MNIRLAEDKDLSQIVQLLKLSLGESLMPKSVEYWTWKHIKNPFGVSPVLIAEENDQIIGVRAFMKWQWQSFDKCFTAIRAVDTATHPDHQGKGIFKKLTLQALEHCQENGIDMVFNTPNEQSKPGYMKMGWLEAGRLSIKIVIRNPLGMLRSKLIHKERSTEFLNLTRNDYNLKTAISKYNGEYKAAGREFRTPINSDYINWRYADVPLIKYYGHANPHSLIIFRLKKSELGIELRICDAFGGTDEVKKSINTVKKTLTYDYLSLSGKSMYDLPGLLKVELGVGPIVTVRKLGTTDINEFKNFNRWSPSLGDLEVF